MHYRLADACVNSKFIIALHHVKNVENRFSSFSVKVGEKMKIVLRLGRNWTIFVHVTRRTTPCTPLIIASRVKIDHTELATKYNYQATSVG